MAQVYDNSGSIGKNPKKTDAKHPDMKGKAVINGTKYWISGWTKETNGDRWLSLSFTPADAQRQDSRPSQNRAPAVAGFNDDNDLPF